MNEKSISMIRALLRGRQSLLRLVASAVLVLVGSTIASAVGASSHSVAVLSESSNGRVLRVNPGEYITVTLHSTYWQPMALSRNPSVIQVGPITKHALLASSTPHCVPGEGCGTVSVHYLALVPGLVRLRATRVSCGEALACTGARGQWSVVVRVR